ncbi:hypothetical protein CP8484711_0899B, partial [Chlamydia psittaci 84-8471/1]
TNTLKTTVKERKSIKLLILSQ